MSNIEGTPFLPTPIQRFKGALAIILMLAVHKKLQPKAVKLPKNGKTQYFDGQKWVFDHCPQFLNYGDALANKWG